MAWLRRFFSLPSPDRRRLAGALFVVGFVRLALWALPFRVVRSLAARLSRPAHPAETGSVAADVESATAARVAWAVGRAGRFVPGATCLVRALAAQVLLAREGVASAVRFGVGRGGGNEFRAHAWLECAGRVVVGGDEDLSRFAPLPAFAWRARPTPERG